MLMSTLVLLCVAHASSVHGAGVPAAKGRAALCSDVWVVVAADPWRAGATKNRAAFTLSKTHRVYSAVLNYADYELCNFCVAL